MLPKKKSSNSVPDSEAILKALEDPKKKEAVIAILKRAGLILG